VVPSFNFKEHPETREDLMVYGLTVVLGLATGFLVVLGTR
jgi:hypothetical protein